jgi:hypothetical protein
MKYTKLHQSKKRLASIVAATLLVAEVALPGLASHTQAAALTNTFVRFDRMAQSTPTTGTVCANPVTTDTETGVKVTFPTGYTVSSTTGNWAVSTTNLAWPAGGTAWPGIAAPTGSGDFQISGQTVGFQSGDLTPGTLYCFNWTNTAALTTKSSATNDNLGTVATRNTSPADVDTGTYATATVSNDQVAVSAAINQSFQMSLSANTDNLGTLTTGSVSASPTPRTVTVNTNAKNGWIAWAKDSTTGGGLRSTNASYTIASTGAGSASQALVAGTEGYNLGVAYSQSTGTCTSGTAVDANFDKAGGANKGGGLDNGLRKVLTCDGTAGSGVITLTNFAAINGSTPAAADYADTETFVAGGIF